MAWTTRLYIYTVSLAALALIVLGLLELRPEQYLLPLALLTAGSFLAQVYELEVVSGWMLSTQVAIALAAVYIGGLPLGVTVVALSTLPAEIMLRINRLGDGLERFLSPVLFNAAQLILSVSAAAAVLAMSRQFLPEFGRTYFAMGLAFVAYVVVNSALVAAVIALSSDDRYARLVRVFLKSLPLQFVTMGILAMLMAFLYEQSPVNLVLAFVPLALVHYSTRNYLKLRRDSHLAFRQITDLLAERDEYTGSHSEDVEALTVRLAEAMHLPDDQVDAVRAGAAIHDIGKIAMPDAILKKLGPLDPEEFETMKQHTIIGADILQNLDVYRKVVPIVRHEHEHWDGGGYPDGLAGEDIPVGARIVAVADVYSALTTERAYRPPQGKPLRYSGDEACGILEQMSGTVLDPELVSTFVAFIRADAAQ